MPIRLEAADSPDSEIILEAIREYTHLLLGTTIGYSEEDWAAPSRLPGWSRSHVAAHLVENARGLLRVCRGLQLNRPTKMYQSEADKAHDIELGALSDGLNLQIELDTSANELQQELPLVSDLDSTVTLRSGYQTPARAIPLARLYEVVLHSLDLDPAADQLQLSPQVADALLQYELERLRPRIDLPALLVESDSGITARLGSAGEPLRVTGPAVALFYWLARDVITSQIPAAIALQG